MSVTESDSCVVDREDRRPAGPSPASGRLPDGRFAPRNAIGTRTQFTPGNWGALQHALRSDRWPPELEVLRDEVDEFLAATLVDEADPGDVPARRKALLTYRARLHRRIVQLDGLLELRGLVDRRNKLRATWLQMLATLIERARHLDVTLGLQRRAKSVPSLQEYLEARGHQQDDGDEARAVPVDLAADEPPEDGGEGEAS